MGEYRMICPICGRTFLCPHTEEEWKRFYERKEDSAATKIEDEKKVPTLPLGG